jgi:hypothetical protein
MSSQFALSKPVLGENVAVRATGLTLTAKRYTLAAMINAIFSDSKF